MEMIEKELMDFKIEKRRKKKRGEKIHKPAKKAETLFIPPHINILASQADRIDNNYLGLNSNLNNINFSVHSNRNRINSFNFGKPSSNPQPSDSNDINRINAPLIKVADAIIIDNGTQTIDQSFDEMSKIIINLSNQK
jgi:hypothetical protein